MLLWTNVYVVGFVLFFLTTLFSSFGYIAKNGIASSCDGLVSVLYRNRANRMYICICRGWRQRIGWHDSGGLLSLKSDRGGGQAGDSGKNCSWQVQTQAGWRTRKSWPSKWSPKVSADPGRLAQLVRVFSCYTRVAGSISGLGTYKNQPMNASISETTKLMFLSQINQ